MPKRFRLLLPWFEEDNAVRLLVDTDPTPERIRDARRRWRTAAAKIAARRIETFNRTTLPLPAALHDRANRFTSETNFASFPGFAGAELRLVELSSLLSFQAKVADGGPALLPAGREVTLEAAFDLCLPAAPPMASVRVVTEGAAAVICSENPNLQFGGFRLNGSILSAEFGFRPPWVQVVEYCDRLVLRNGTHRCRALLANGARYAVAVVVKAQTFAELGADGPGFISAAHLTGTAPPFVADFEDPDLWAEFLEPDSEHVIMITATEAAQVPAAALRSPQEFLRSLRAQTALPPT